MQATHRLFAIVQILRDARQPIQAHQLAERLEVSVRTIYRDIAELQHQYLPITGEAGVGYVLKKGYDLPPLMLTPNEIEAALLGAQWVAQQGEPSLAKAAELVMDKIRAVLPKDLQTIVQQPNIVAVRRNTTPRDKIDIALIRKAIHEQNIVTIEYTDQNGSHSQRHIWPFLVAYFEEARVIAAWCELRNDFRHFRTDQITRVDITQDRFYESPQELKQKWWAKELQNDAIHL